MEVSLGSKVKQGTIWVIVERFFSRAFTFVRLLILAYLLSPSDFGLVGIVTTTLFFIDILTRTGFDSALIQKKEGIDDYLDVAWTINLIKGFVEMLILVVLVVPLSNFYGEPSLVPLFLVVALTTVIGGFNSIRMVTLYKEMNNKKISRYNIAIASLTSIVTIGLAYWLRNVWSLALGVVFQTLFSTIGSFIIAPYRPRFVLNAVKVKDLWSFGKWQLLSGIFITFFMQGDDLFVGKVLGIAALGFYSMAYKVGNIVATELVDSLRTVLFPAFSRLQDDPVRLRKAYLAIYHITASIGAIFAVGMSLLAPEFVSLFLGPKWIEIVTPLQVLAIWGGFQMLSTSTAPLFSSLNRPDLFAKVQAVKLAILAVLIYPFSIKWGITGTASAVLIASMVEVPIGMSWTRQVLDCTYRDILVPLLVPFTSAAVVSIVYYLIHGAILLPNLLHLLLFGIIIVVLYAFVAFILDRLLKAGLWLSIQTALSK